MIAHLRNGEAITLRPEAPTMGLEVVRWEFDFEDMRWYVQYPEAFTVLYTRMTPEFYHPTRETK